MKTLHQTFDVAGFDRLSYKILSDSTLVEPWAGNTLMTETRIELYGASPSLLRHFIEKEKRYQIESDTLENTTIHLFSTVDERRTITTKNGDATEIVRVRLFVPEDFIKKEGNLLVRKDKDQ